MKRITLLLVLLASSLLLSAQEGLSIAGLFGHSTAFDHPEDVTETHLSGKKLKVYRLTLFRSLKVENATAADIDKMERAVKSDAARAVDKQLLRRGNSIHYAFCKLPDRQGLHRYLIYRNKARGKGRGNELHLIYMEGTASPEDLESIFK